MEKNEDTLKESPQVKSLVIVFSYHHNNTEKIANACAKALGAEVKTPQQVRPEEIAEYDLVGFGSGIYSATFDPSVLDLADRLRTLRERKPSSSRPTGRRPSLQTGSSSKRITGRSGKSSRRKGTRLSGNSGVQGGTRTVFSGSLEV